MTTRNETGRFAKFGRTSIGLLALGVLLGSLESAEAYPSYYNSWKSAYPGSMTGSNVLTGTGANCQLCHEQSGGGKTFNGYGWNLRQEINKGKSITQAFAAVEALDSDADPAATSNLAEMTGHSQPGWTAGASNTIYNKNGSTTANQPPPSGILGSLDPCAGTAVAYCTAKTNSLGCVPAIGSTGTPSASASSGFVLTGSNVRNNKPGLSFYKVNGSQASVAFQCGFLCVGPSGIKRTPARSAGGNPGPANDCSGVYSLDMNAFAQGLAGGSPDPALQVPGSQVHTQWWGRDQGFSQPCNTTLTDALQYDVCP
jgi:hypothetical protein